MRATNAEIDYVENQCVSGRESEQQDCDYVEYEGRDIGLPDLQATVEDAEEVRRVFVAHSEKGNFVGKEARKPRNRRQIRRSNSR